MLVTNLWVAIIVKVSPTHRFRLKIPQAVGSTWGS